MCSCTTSQGGGFDRSDGYHEKKSDRAGGTDRQAAKRHRHTERTVGKGKRDIKRGVESIGFRHGDERDRS